MVPKVVGSNPIIHPTKKPPYDIIRRFLVGFLSGFYQFATQRIGNPKNSELVVIPAKVLYVIRKAHCIVVLSSWNIFEEVHEHPSPPENRLDPVPL